MSWDVWIFRAPEGLEVVSDLPSGYVFPSFNRREVHAAAEERSSELRRWAGSAVPTIEPSSR